MKNASLILVLILTSSVCGSNQLNTSVAVDKMNRRQARFYGPLIGLLLTALLSKTTAKLAPGSFHLSYTPNPWLEKLENLSHLSIASHHDNHNNIKDPNWHDVNNSPTPPPFATAAPTIQPSHYTLNNHHPSNEIVNIHEHNNNNHQLVGNFEDVYEDLHEIHELIPAESNRKYLTTIPPKRAVKRATDRYHDHFHDHINDRFHSDHFHSDRRFLGDRFDNRFNQGFDGHINDQRGRYNPNRYNPDRRNKFFPKRSRPTTTPDYYNYDDLDEDYDVTTQKFKPKRNRPRRPTTTPDSYEYDDNTSDSEYDYDYEFTTKPPRRRKTTVRTTTPKRRKNKTKPKNKKKRPEVLSSESGSEEDSTENDRTTIIAKQRQTTTTEPSTETDITNGTTTAPNMTTMNPNTTMNFTGYGYGPSNGNENISITYGPPVQNQFQPSYPLTQYGTPLTQYGAPYPSYPRPSYGAPSGQYQIPTSDWVTGQGQGSNPNSNNIPNSSASSRLQDFLGFDAIF